MSTSDAANQVVWQWNSDPFGTTAASGALEYNLRFPGQYFDAETQLHYNYFRDYNPRTGRYVQSDPIGLLSEEHTTYAYVGSEPLMWLDALGLRRTTLESNRVRGNRYRDAIYKKVVDECPSCTVIREYYVRAPNKKKRFLDIAVFRNGPPRPGQLPDLSIEAKCGKSAKRNKQQEQIDAWMNRQGVTTLTVTNTGRRR